MSHLRASAKILLFLSSYIPLFAIIAFLAREQIMHIRGVIAPWISIVLIGVIIVSFIFLVQVVRLQASGNTDFKKVDEYKQRNDQVTSYLLVYIIPFLGFDIFSFDGAIIFAFFFFMIGVIQIRSEQLHVNPVLAFLGYDIYRVKFGREISLVVTPENIENKLISSDRAHPEDDELFLKVAKLGQGVYITSKNAS